MADLVAIEYDDMYKALEVRLTLLKLQRDYLIDMEDAVVAVNSVTSMAGFCSIRNGSHPFAPTRP